jgi:hypothetical protein
MHIHGHHFRITATDGDDIPLSAQWPETAVLVAVRQTRNVEFIADAPGDWAFHCHMTHHVMKGATGPFGDYISMGGLFTVVKVRDRLKSYDEDPGWYQHPPGTVAVEATDAELARDGINVNEPSASGGEKGGGSATKEPVGVSPTARPRDPHKRH